MEQHQGPAVETLKRLAMSDARAAAAELGPNEARFLVDMYYLIQKDRIRAGNQFLALGRAEEPAFFEGWLRTSMEAVEVSLQKILDQYSAAHPVGEWARSISGIGPVLAAGLLAHIDITKAPTVGHIWRFAGLDPTVTWEKGQKRPWNTGLKTLCWKIGESFVKVSSNERDIYGKVWKERKDQEWKANLSGSLSDQAAAALDRKRFGKDTDALLWYSACLTEDAARKFLALPAGKQQGAAKKLAGEPGSGIAMLPPGHIHARAKRYAVKLFLSHLHDVWYRYEFKKAPPLPYPIAALGHAHYIAPPAA